MTRIIFIIYFLYFGMHLNAQSYEKNIRFTRVLNYEFNTLNTEKEFLTMLPNGLQYYITENLDYGLAAYTIDGQSYYSKVENYVLMDKKNIIYLNLHAISRQARVNQYSSVFDYKDDHIFKGFILEKTATENKIAGQSCKNYIFSKDLDKITLCINEKSSYNNASLVHSQLKGLVTEIIVENEGRKKYHLILKNNQPTDLAIKINEKEIEDALIREKELLEIEKNSEAAVEAATDESASFYEDDFDYEDPLYNHYYSNTYKAFNMEEKTNLFSVYYSILGYITSNYPSEKEPSRAQIIDYLKAQYKPTLKNFYKSGMISKQNRRFLEDFFKYYIKEVEAYQPKPTLKKDLVEEDKTSPNDDWETLQVLPYESYKNIEVSDEPNLALNMLEKDSPSLHATPKFCMAINHYVPSFENENLRKHVLNYLGQLCDMYLYGVGENVDYFSTLGSIRKSLWEIENIRSKLSKKDMELLQKLILSLD